MVNCTIIQNKEVKIHLGCGTRYIPGFVNIDYSAKVKTDMMLKLGEDALPFDAATVSLLVSSHLLEHLTKYEGLFFLKECYRVLKPGGLLYLALPDIAKVIDIYCNGHPEVPHLKNNQEWIIRALFETQHDETIIHKYGYTEKTLTDLMTSLGFVQTNINIPENEWIQFNGVDVIQKIWGQQAAVWVKL